MNEILARAARLLQNPELINNLPEALKDPQALARLAGLGPDILGRGLLNDDKLKLLSGIGNTVSGLLKGFPPRTESNVAPTRTSRPSLSANPVACRKSSKGTAITATVSLTAITGAVVAVGTVSAVALAKGRKAR
ncbi:MAG TPA: hypothetical protein VK670_02670 [Silvibacterium sp.]|nr:hypothetical protein [Silvibacterium sp.]